MNLDPWTTLALTSAYLVLVVAQVMFWWLFVYWTERVFRHLGYGRIAALFIRGARALGVGSALTISGLLAGTALTTMGHGGDHLLVRLASIYGGLVIQVVGVYWLCKGMAWLRVEGRRAVGSSATLGGGTDS